MILSIITITFNNKQGLLKTLKSINYKISKSFEIIIIDNNSTDGTREIVENFKNKLKNIIHIEEPDQGIYDAMNKGIDQASGEYIIFMNAGDNFFEKTSLDHIISTCEKKKYDFIYGNYFDEKSSRFKKAKSLEYLSSGMITSHQAMIYNLGLINENNIKYNVDYSIAADFLFTYEYLRHSRSDYYLDLTVASFEKPNKSRFTIKSLLENHKVRRKHFENSLIIDLQITLLHLIKNIIVKIV